jgi:NAD(P)-dependent dehydrogenase (short-subunit alcohol dehydrogenase family)
VAIACHVRLQGMKSCDERGPPSIACQAAKSARSANRSRILSNSVRRAIPIGRLGTPEDIADMIAFLASMRARYITGAVIEANGGRQPP